MKRNLPDKVLIEEWYSDRRNMECAARLGIKPDRLTYLWKILRDSGRIPRQSRSKKRLKVGEVVEERPYTGPEDFDGRPRIERDLLLEALIERGHEYAP